MKATKGCRLLSLFAKNITFYCTTMLHLTAMPSLNNTETQVNLSPRYIYTVPAASTQSPKTKGHKWEHCFLCLSCSPCTALSHALFNILSELTVIFFFFLNVSTYSGKCQTKTCPPSLEGQGFVKVVLALKVAFVRGR